MSDVVIVGLLSLAGTLMGSVAGILTANKLTVYRIEQLEKKVDKHNQVQERVAVQERDMKTAFKQLDVLREDIADMRKEKF